MQPLVAEYDNMLRCIRCAACLTSCPTYVVTLKEEEGPRGRIAIMRAIVEGHLDVTPDAITHLDNCLLCEACTNVCPAGVQYGELLEQSPEAIGGVLNIYAGINPWQLIVNNQLCSVIQFGGDIELRGSNA